MVFATFGFYGNEQSVAFEVFHYCKMIPWWVQSLNTTKLDDNLPLVLSSVSRIYFSVEGHDKLLVLLVSDSSLV